MTLVAITLLVLASILLARHAQRRNDRRLARVAFGLSVAAAAVAVWAMMRMLADHAG